MDRNNDQAKPRPRKPSAIDLERARLPLERVGKVMIDYPELADRIADYAESQVEEVKKQRAEVEERRKATEFAVNLSQRLTEVIGEQTLIEQAGEIVAAKKPFDIKQRSTSVSAEFFDQIINANKHEQVYIQRHGARAHGGAEIVLKAPDGRTLTLSYDRWSNAEGFIGLQFHSTRFTFPNDRQDGFDED